MSPFFTSGVNSQSLYNNFSQNRLMNTHNNINHPNLCSEQVNPNHQNQNFGPTQPFYSFQKPTQGTNENRKNNTIEFSNNHMNLSPFVNNGQDQSDYLNMMDNRNHGYKEHQHQRKHKTQPFNCIDEQMQLQQLFAENLLIGDEQEYFESPTQNNPSLGKLYGMPNINGPNNFEEKNQNYPYGSYQKNLMATPNPGQYG